MRLALRSTNSWLNDMNYGTYKLRPRVPLHTVFGIALLVQLPGWAIGQEPQPSRQNHVATFTVEKHGDPLLLPVTIDGVTGPFMLDSGASLHVLDQRFKSKLGKPITTNRVNTAGSPVSVALFEPPKLLVGRLAVKRDRPVANIDLTRLSEVLGRDVHGVLGAPFLLNRIVTVDFDRGIVGVLELGESSQESWGVALPLRVDSNGHAYLQDVAIGSDKMSFLLDTGMNSSMTLARSEFERLQSRGLITSLRTSQITTASGDVERRTGRLESLSLGPFRHTSIIVGESTSNKIGLGYLSRFRATIDVPRHRLYLARGDSYAKTDDADKSGLHLSWINKRVVVDLVDNHSPAQRAGIIKGDVVLDVNGTLATGASLGRLRHQLRSNEGKEQRLTLVRGERKLTARFSLQEYADWNPPNADSGREDRTNR